MDTKQLLVLRHAKAGEHVAHGDHERALTQRGRRDATAVGDYLRAHGITVDLALCSTAVRTRETLEGLALDGPVELDATLYNARTGTLLARLQSVPDDVVSVLLVGHNPSVHELVVTLTDDATCVPWFPTAALAVLRAPVATWADLRPGVATVESFVTPKHPD